MTLLSLTIVHFNRRLTTATTIIAAAADCCRCCLNQRLRFITWKVKRRLWRTAAHARVCILNAFILHCRTEWIGRWDDTLLLLLLLLYWRRWRWWGQVRHTSRWVCLCLVRRRCRLITLALKWGQLDRPFDLFLIGFGGGGLNPIRADWLQRIKTGFLEIYIYHK